MLILFSAPAFHLMFSCCVLCKGEGGGHHNTARLEKNLLDKKWRDLRLKASNLFLDTCQLQEHSISFSPSSLSCQQAEKGLKWADCLLLEKNQGTANK